METKRATNKKNSNRPKAKDKGLVSSIQSNYKKKEKEENINQQSLL